MNKLDENCVGITFELKGSTNIDEAKLNSVILLIRNLRQYQEWDYPKNEVEIITRNRTIDDAIKILETMKIDIKEM